MQISYFCCGQSNIHNYELPGVYSPLSMIRMIESGTMRRRGNVERGGSQ